MDKPFVSIIMSVYGVENYIEAGIKSILAQTSDDWELIIVDDKTVDGSMEIVEKFAAKDKRIHIYAHDTNKGLSEARNTGTKYASGLYLWYMDPDDTADNTLIESVKVSVESNHAQIVLFGLEEEYYKSNGRLSYSHVIKPCAKQFNSKKALRHYVPELEVQTLLGYAWNKFYSREYITKHNIKFESVKLIEDIVFNIHAFRDVESLNTLSTAPYHYAKRGTESLTNKFVPDYYKLHRRRIEELYNLMEYWKLNTMTNRGIFGALYARYILSALQRNCDKRSGMDKKARRKFIQNIFKDHLYTELIPYAKSEDSRTLKIWISVLKKQKTRPCMAFGRLVHITRKGLPMMYNRTKSGR